MVRSVLRRRRSAADFERVWLRCDAGLSGGGAAEVEASGGQSCVQDSAADDRRDDREERQADSDGSDGCDGEGNGVQVLPLQLFPTLRVSGVWGPNGEALDFIQEDKMKDADFAVVLKKPLAAGETIQITTSYSGKDAVISISAAGTTFWWRVRTGIRICEGDFGKLCAVLHDLSHAEGSTGCGDGQSVSEQGRWQAADEVWQSLTPMPVAGFNLGEFKI
jgi:hypothetical protein